MTKPKERCPVCLKVIGDRPHPVVITNTAPDGKKAYFHPGCLRTMARAFLYVKLGPDKGPLDGTRIVAAAYRYPNGTTITLPAPARHGDVLKAAKKAGLPGPVKHDWQGFITNRGKFVDRVVAFHIAKSQNQFKPDMLRERRLEELFTEDLW